jgi:hypothetical protein
MNENERSLNPPRGALKTIESEGNYHETYF